MVHKQIVNSEFVSPKNSSSVRVTGSQKQGAGRDAEKAVSHSSAGFAVASSLLADVILIYCITSAEQDERSRSITSQPEDLPPSFNVPSQRNVSWLTGNRVFRGGMPSDPLQGIVHVCGFRETTTS